MELKRLVSHESLITEISGEVATLAAFLEVPYNVRSEYDHIYIKRATPPIELGSFFTRRDSDVMVSPKVFCEILMDIKGGLTILEAYNKQGYIF